MKNVNQYSIKKVGAKNCVMYDIFVFFYDFFNECSPFFYFLINIIRMLIRETQIILCWLWFKLDLDYSKI